MDEDPEDIANALIGGPALVLGAVLNGSILPPGFPLPGILTPGGIFDASLPGPIGLGIGLGKLLQALATPQETTSLLRQENEQFRTLDVNVNQGIQQNALPGGGATVVEEKKPELKGTEEAGNVLDGNNATIAGLTIPTARSPVTGSSAETPRA